MCLYCKGIPPIIAQSWVAMGVLTGILAQGMVISFTSNMLVGLNAPDSIIMTDHTTLSWLAGCMGITSLLGAPVATSLMYYHGRRKSFIVTLLPGILGTALIYFASNIPLLLLGRLLHGLSFGAICILAIIITGEYSSPKQRGMFLNLKTTWFYLGSTVEHVLGNYFHWKVVAACIMVPQIVSLLSALTWPESPSWLVSKSRFDDCEKAFTWLRGTDDGAQMELETMMQAQRKIASGPKQTIIGEAVAIVKKFTRKDFLKPLAINFTCAVLIEACGRHIFPAYAVQIITEVTQNKSNVFYYALCIDLILTVSTSASSVLVKMMKRRTLLFTSGISSLVVLLALCPYLYLTSAKVVMIDQSWIPIIMIVVYLVNANVGCVPISLGLIGETLPFEHRCIGGMLASMSISLCTLVGLKSIPYLLLHIKIYGTFALLGVFLAISLAVLYFMLPETKDRTLQEIEEDFQIRNKDARIGETEKMIA